MNTELVQLIKEILVSFMVPLIGVFLGAFLAYHFSERQKRKKEHFMDLKEKIFKPWRSELVVGLDYDYQLRYEYEANYLHAESWVMRLLNGVENILWENWCLFKECNNGEKTPQY